MYNVKIIGISGLSGSGKTHVSNILSREFNVPIQPIQLDWFFKNRKQDLLEIPESINFQLFLKEIKNIKFNLEKGIVSHEINTPYGVVDLEINNFYSDQTMYIIIEGFLLYYWRDVTDMCDIRYFVDCDYEVAKTRRYKRDLKYNPKISKEDFDFWYKNVVYRYFLEYIETQLDNLNKKFLIIKNL